jgi:gliding motility-associated-like protein
MKPFHKIISILFLLFFAFNSFATHNRAGEITYVHVSGFTYRFTITTYTKVSGTSADADRTRLGISWGDGTNDSLDRVSQVFLDADIKQNKYVGIHTYSAPFTYVVGVTDPNRIDQIININNSVNTLFYLEDTVTIVNPNILGYNSSPQLLNPPIEYGNVGELFIHNPNAFDPDGDSLTFTIIAPQQASGLPVSGYTPPNLISPGPNNQISINQQTGELRWDAPQRVGIYNIAILIREYRAGVLIGTVIRDLQIIVSDTRNNPPRITVPLQLCVIAGDSITVNVSADDPNLTDKVTLSANGAPFTLPTNPARFVVNPPANPVTGVFTWRTSCDHLIKNDYLIVFNAVDNFVTPPLTDSKTLAIKVLAPPPLNLTSTLNILNKTVRLKWDSLYTCSNSTRFLNFSVWRKKGCGFPLDTCNNDLANAGYEKIGNTNNYSFIDNTILSGNQYSYRVVANFGDKTTVGIIINPFSSLASDETCILVPADLPLIYNVDVRNTDAATGQIYVEWSRPFAERLDTVTNPGPYVFKLYRSVGITNNYTLITTKTFGSFSGINDTSFLDTGLNTVANAYNYRVAFFARTTDSLGISEPASSVFLNVAPSFEALDLSWFFNVPWLNNAYTIFRKLPGSSTFDSLTTVNITTYRDINLQNDSLYCYKIKAVGAYPITGLKTPLINFSQEVCERPRDTIPPCTPILTVNNFCTDNKLDTSEYKNYLTWTYNQSANCKTDDINKIRIFYAKLTTDTLKQIDSIVGSLFNNYTHILSTRSLAGCYAVQAIRQNGNESILSNKVCVDNCPLYKLPNTFTPNGNGQNDLFTPIYPIRFVEKIDMKIYNRWGNLVFETMNPDINWDGYDYKTKKPLFTGVYYYICDVYYQTIDGIRKLDEPLSGYIHLFRE